MSYPSFLSPHWLLLGIVVVGCRSDSFVDPTLRPRAVDASRRGEWPEAAELWHNLYLAEGGNSVDSIRQCARAMLEAGEVEAAHSMACRGLKLEAGDPTLLEIDGAALIALGFRRRAESCYEEALESDPNRIESLKGLARVRVELGYEEGAMIPLQKVIELTEGDAETWVLYAKACAAARNYPAAFSSYKKAFALPSEPDPGDLVRAAQLYQRPGLRDSTLDVGTLCRDWLEQAVAKDPQDATAWFQLGVLHEDFDKPAEAVQAYRRVVELDVFHLPALTNLALLHNKRGEKDQAQAMVERALQLEKDPVRQRALQDLIK